MIESANYKAHKENIKSEIKLNRIVITVYSLMNILML